MRIEFVHHVYISGLILLLINVTKCYRTGAGPQSCSSMVPFHSNTQPQLGPVPYVITVSKTTYTPREQIVGKYHRAYFEFELGRPIRTTGIVRFHGLILSKGYP